MSQAKRVGIAVGLIVLLLAIVVGFDLWRRNAAASAPARGAQLGASITPASVPAGAIPIYLNGELAGSFTPDDLSSLEKVSFVDSDEGKTQEGWRLADILALKLETASFSPDATVIVSSSSRDKEAVMTWEEVSDPENWVMFDLSNRGTLKLTSVLEQLDARDEWVQDSDRIEVRTP